MSLSFGKLEGIFLFFFSKAEPKWNKTEEMVSDDSFSAEPSLHSLCKQAEVSPSSLSYYVKTSRWDSNPLIDFHPSPLQRISSRPSSKVTESDGDYKPLIALSKAQQHLFIFKFYTLNKSKEK